MPIRYSSIAGRRREVGRSAIVGECTRKGRFDGTELAGYIRLVKILWVGNSNDRPSAEVLEGQLRHKLLEPRLAEAIGEPVDITSRPLWPTEDAPRVMSGWLERWEPDIVYLKANQFWFNHESVPLRIERMLGPLGRPIARAGLRANETGWLAHNSAFRSARDLARRRIQGAYLFEPDEVVQRLGECIRVVLRTETTYLLVASSFGISNSSSDATTRRRTEARRLAVHRGLERLCGELHVDYIGADQPHYLTQPPIESHLQSDQFHRAARGHAEDVDKKFALLLPACQKAMEHRRGDARPAKPQPSTGRS